MSHEINWASIEYFFIKLTGKKPDVNAVLFMIGLRELGVGNKKFTKEQKQDLMHIANCKILSYSGHYKLEGKDEDGWPHWALINAAPTMPLEEQEEYIKEHIIQYFVSEEVLG